MTEPRDLAGLRQSYETHGWGEREADPDPVAQFRAWFEDAVAAGLPEPNAMVLSTASADGLPSARTVLLKGHDERGFRFFTNYTSRKAADLAENPRACLLFPWHAMARQVIVSGPVGKVTAAETAEYFRSRPHGSRLGAWASHQSAPIPSRAVLEQRQAELEQRWPEEVPVPDFWGGYLLTPERIEFWQGRPDRLHDRIAYLSTDHIWELVRLSP